MYEINGIKFNVFIERKKIKNMYLRVEDDGLHITCSNRITYKEINDFIKEKESWILKIVNSKPKESKTAFKDYVYLNGKKYKLVVIYGNDDVKVGNDIIYIFSKSNKKKDVEVVFYEWGKKYLKEFVLLNETKYLNILHDYGYNINPVYNFKYLKSMWGCCYIKKNIVNLSVRLIHFEDECKEAVLWHELLHFVIPNHSKRFNYVLDLHMPKYKEIIRKLDK